MNVCSTSTVHYECHDVYTKKCLHVYTFTCTNLLPSHIYITCSNMNVTHSVCIKFSLLFDTYFVKRNTCNTLNRKLFPLHVYMSCIIMSCVCTSTSSQQESTHNTKNKLPGLVT